ncbi:response regulator [Inhella crocodyli]|uniref:Response regulator n=1 Tax=Inhella crocodyli TaxID=2499851 RepID=A0A437LC88_9BURK|nr:response regulator [Inhella crocodyli]RVT82943.1 response regulator [Inhella crocodyli]
MTPLRVLLVDDEPHILQALHRQIRHHFRDASIPVEVDLESDPVAAVQRIQTQAYAVVVSDYRMPGLNGADVLAELRCLQPHCARIMLSGQVDRDGLAAAINAAQVQRFLMKPWNDAELILALEAGLAHYLGETAQAEALARADFHPGETSGSEPPAAA